MINFRLESMENYRVCKLEKSEVRNLVRKN